jgi:TP901 family phage tail tape measure protein
MSVAGNLVINLMGNTQHLNRALTRSASRIRAFSATSSRSLTSFGTTTAATMAAVGTGAAVAARAVRNMTLAMGGGLVVAAGLSFKRLISFDDAIRRAGARARTSAQGIELLRERALELGRTTSFTATQVAEMQEGLAKGGFNVSDTNEMVNSVLALSRAAGTDGTTAANLLGDSIGIFGLKASQASGVASVLAGVVNRTRTDIEQLADGFKFAAKTGADLGLSFSDTIAIMGTLAQAGLRGSLAGTALRKIGQITVSEADKISKTFGVNFKETENGTVNVIENFEILSKSMQGLSRSGKLAGLFEVFGIRGAGAASSLAESAESTKALAAELKAVMEAGTEANDTMAAMDAGPGGAMRRLLSAVEGLGLAFASALEEPAMDAMEGIKQGVNSLSTFLKTKWPVQKDIIADNFIVGEAMASFIMDNWVDALTAAAHEATSQALKIINAFKDTTQEELRLLTVQAMGEKAGRLFDAVTQATTDEVFGKPGQAPETDTERLERDMLYAHRMAAEKASARMTGLPFRNPGYPTLENIRERMGRAPRERGGILGDQQQESEQIAATAWSRLRGAANTAIANMNQVRDTLAEDQRMRDQRIADKKIAHLLYEPGATDVPGPPGPTPVHPVAGGPLAVALAEVAASYRRDGVSERDIEKLMRENTKSTIRQEHLMKEWVNRRILPVHLAMPE